jgi:hypothetical protein
MIGLYKRHVADREHKSAPQYKRCHCPVWYQTNRDGKLTRWSSEDRSWEAANVRHASWTRLRQRGRHAPPPKNSDVFASADATTATA